VFVLFVLCGIFADLLAPYGFNEIAPIERLKPPSWRHPFGTDNLGRDLLSRCLFGATLSVIIGLSAAALATVISVAIGMLTGYLGGRIDMLGQRLVDSYMSFPELVILIAVVSVVGPGMPQIIACHLCSVCRQRISPARCRCARICTSMPHSRSGRRPHASSGGTSCPTSCRRSSFCSRRVGAVILIRSWAVLLGLGVPPPAPTWGGLLSGSGALHVSGTVARVCARSLSDDSRLRHQRVRGRWGFADRDARIKMTHRRMVINAVG
jgi:peptide/nickel transport system permease protein